MSYLQQGHVEKAFYERSNKSYLNKDNTSFLDADNSSFLVSPTATYLTSSSDSFLTTNLTDKSYLDRSNSSFLQNSTDSFIQPTTKSFMENSSTSYLSAVSPLNNTFLQTNRDNHVIEDNAHHLDEDKQNHLEESGGETSDEDNEDFSHAIDWSLVVPPLISPTFINGKTKYLCALTNKTTKSMPVIPERFDIFDYDKQQLIVTISRYHIKKGADGMNGQQKYRQLQRNKQDLHKTELQSLALEKLRVWKHKKEQELLGQVDIENADYSDRTQRMGVGDHSASGAAERKKRRELLQKQQQDERSQQMALKLRLKQDAQLKSQENLVSKQRLAQQRQRQQQNAVISSQNRRQQLENERKEERMRGQQEKQMFVKIQSKNISQQRKQQTVDAMYASVLAQQNEELNRAQQRNAQQVKTSNFVKIESKNISQQRKQEILNMMQYDLDEKYNSQESQRRVKKNEFDSFLSNLTKSQEDARMAMGQERSDRVAQQDADRKRREKEMAQQRRQRQQEAEAKEAERVQKMEIKTFVNKINNLLEVKSVGIDFDEFPNEYYFKYNTNWNPRRIMGLTDLDDILRSNGLRSTVEILSSGMTKRAILRKHYQKIAIVSRDVNDILTVLAISDNIDGAIRQLRQMMNQKQQSVKVVSGSTPYGMQASFSPQTNYSASNNWGLPRGYRVKKTAKGRLFFINDSTKETTWIDPRPMPRGWRSNATSQGKRFYINDNTKQTTWNDPRPKIYI